MNVLASGDSDIASVAITLTNEGIYYIRACADKKQKGDIVGLVDEGTNEGNNCSADWTAIIVSGTASPDLVASNVPTNSAQVGEPTMFSSIITNQGTITTGQKFVNLFETSTNISDPNNPMDLLGYPTSEMKLLDVGESGTASKSLTFDTGGTYYVRACADKESISDAIGKIDETIEGNNCSADWTAVTVTGPISGICMAEHYLCGFPTSLIAGSDKEKIDPVTLIPTWTWTCGGLYGGSPKSCSQEGSVPVPVNDGVCGISTYECAKGAVVKQPDGTNPKSWKWDCVPAVGGKTVSCLIKQGPPPGKVCNINKKVDGQETGIDCGGPDCPTCKIPKFKEN